MRGYDNLFYWVYLVEVGNLFQELADYVGNEKECLSVCGSDGVVDYEQGAWEMSSVYWTAAIIVVLCNEV